MRVLATRLLLIAAAILLARDAGAAPLTDAEQACVDAMNDAGLAVARAQAALTDACLDPAAPGAAADVPGCVANDADGDLVGATKATFDGAVAACSELPPFGVAPTVDQGVNDAAVTHVRGLFTDAFGSSPSGAMIVDASDTKGRRCQAGVAKGMEAIVIAHVGRFGRCAERALAKGAENADALAACNASSVKGPVAKARKKLVSQARRRCKGTTTATVLGGRCAGEGTATGAARCLGTRAVCRACRIANAMDGLDTDCDLVDDGADNDSCTFLVSLSGDAIPFDKSPGGRIEGADISLVEHPDRHVTTGPDGHFVFDGLEEGSEATVVLSHPDYHAIQTGTIELGPKGIDRVTFQAVIFDIYDILAALLGVMPDDANLCQMVTTVTRVGKSIYDPGAHGEDGVTVTLDPPLAADHGPIYFNSSVLPDRALTQTSDDGGVLFIQVPPGEYTWTAHKGGAVFSRIKMKCRVGFLVNASPPKGLQRH
jgi:hypothetical protein